MRLLSSLNNASGTVPGFKLPKGDGRQMVDGAMNSGSAILTSATAAFSARDIGKIIVIAGAGIDGAGLSTSINSVTSATTITLNANAGTTVSNQSFTYGSDCTANLQTAITAAAAAGGGKIYAPAGIYMLGGALQTANNYNAQVKLPNIPPTSPSITISLEGALPLVGAYLQFTGWSAPTSGTVFFSTIAGSGTLPCVIGGPNLSAQGYPNFSSLMFCARNITIRQANNPSLSDLYLRYVGCAQLDNVACDVNVNCLSIMQPSHPGATGIVFPGDSNNAFCAGTNLYVLGRYRGYENGEHAVLDNIIAQSCLTAMRIPFAYHTSSIGRLGSYECPNVLEFTGTHHLTIANLDIENASASMGYPAWMNPVSHISDTNNYGRGTVVWHAVTAGVGVDKASFVMVSGSSLRVNCLDDGIATAPAQSPTTQTFTHGTDTVQSGNALKSDTIGAQTGGQWYQNPAQINDKYRTPTFTLTAGTYHLTQFGTRGPSNGIQTLSLRNSGDGTLAGAFGTVDNYASATAYNVTTTSGSITASSAPITLSVWWRVKMPPRAVISSG